MNANGAARRIVEIGCGACTRFDSEERWGALPLVKTMGAADLASIVARWGTRSIEVRKCTSCGRVIARMVPPRTG
jgi:hypothetical protein